MICQNVWNNTRLQIPFDDIWNSVLLYLCSIDIFAYCFKRGNLEHGVVKNCDLVVHTVRIMLRSMDKHSEY